MIHDLLIMIIIIIVIILHANTFLFLNQSLESRRVGTGSFALVNCTESG